MNASLKPSQIIVMASGAVMFVFSFLAFFSADGDGKNAWSGDVGTLFMATWPALFGLIAAGTVAAAAFGNVTLPERILTFDINQVNFILAFTSAVIMVGYLLGGGWPGIIDDVFDAFGDDVGISKGIGFYFMLLGSLGLVAGTVMELLEADGSTPSQAGGQPPTTF